MIDENEIVETNVKELQKSQTVRLIDVFVIAPICVYAGFKYSKTMPYWLSLSLIGIGLATFVYNGKNYLENKNNLKLVE
jgi:hypothetical protein